MASCDNLTCTRMLTPRCGGRHGSIKGLVESTINRVVINVNANSTDDATLLKQYVNLSLYTTVTNCDPPLPVLWSSKQHSACTENCDLTPSLIRSLGGCPLKARKQMRVCVQT